MLFSLKLLKKLVRKDFTADELCSRLTFSGFEVEGRRKMAEASKLVVGRIRTCEKHPDSDHLHLLTVDCGKEGILDIVCGAPNARAGLCVIVALPGCVLPALGETIQRGTIRGKESNGMCCSLSELGVDKSILSEKQLAGIEELPDDAPIGESDVLSYLGLDDEILDINVLPNRPDCLSYIGMAREIASLFETDIVPLPKADLSAIPSVVKTATETGSCVRFDMLSLRHVVPQDETPLPIRRYLEASGIRPLSPIVDLGNFSMLLTGQPLNLYDAAYNPKGSYVIRDGYEGEFVAFDGKKYLLKKGDVVVTDGEKVLCLGGIEAGECGKILPTTADVDIELACFYHKAIRHTSARLGLSSFSSQLFCKERNPALIGESAEVTLALLPTFLKSYEVFSYTTCDKTEKNDRSFPFSLAKLNARLGSAYSEQDVDRVLKAYRIKRQGDRLLPPVDRVDLKEQCDIDEEVFRFFPASKVVPSLSAFPVTHGALSEEQRKTRRLEDLLRDAGLDECITYTLVSEREDAQIRVFDHKDAYRVANPMTKDHAIVRRDLLPSMLSAILRNRAKQKNDVRFFEISPIDTPEGNRTYLAIGLSGERHVCDFFRPETPSFFEMKGLVERILEVCGLSSTRYRLEASRNPAFNPMASADVYVGKTLAGTFGFLSPKVDKGEALLGEIDLSLLLSVPTGKTKAKAYPAFAPVRRDLSFRLDGKATFQDVRKAIQQARIPHVSDVRLFDLFKDGDGTLYLGVSLLLSSDKAMTEKEIGEDMQKAVDAVREKAHLPLRGQENA